MRPSLPPGQLVLYGYWRSSSTWRVRTALALKGLSYQLRPVNLAPDAGEQHSEGFRAVNPLAEAPVLEIEPGPDGRPRRLTQSMAIIQYVERTAPAPALFPSDPFLQARAIQLAEIVNSAIQPLQNLAVLQKVQRELRGDPDAWARHYMERGLRALEALVPETSGVFMIGDQPTVADLYLVPQLYNARRRSLPLEPYPRLLAIEKACLAQPAFQRSHPDVQPDARP